jgi:hypothetical protein
VSTVRGSLCASPATIARGKVDAALALRPVEGWLSIGSARCSTDAQDLTAQRDGLTRIGVTAERKQVDHGLTGTNRVNRPGFGRGSIEPKAVPHVGDETVAQDQDPV